MSIPTNAVSTELDAVNQILSSVGQAPVTTLDLQNPEVGIVVNTLREVNRQVQAEGWIFNTEYGYPLPVNKDGEIAIPDNILSADFPPGSDIVVVQRKGKLYDRTNHTYKFDGPLELDVIWKEDFEDVPEALKQYIIIRAANVFAGRSVGSGEAVRFGQQEEAQARASALEYETQQGDYSIFSDRNNITTYRSTRPVHALFRF